jgi:hypothetical protein
MSYKPKSLRCLDGLDLAADPGECGGVELLNARLQPLYIIYSSSAQILIVLGNAS